MLAFLRSLDPKLVSSILTVGLSRAVLAFGGDPVGDPFWNSVIALALGGFVGFLWPNEGTRVRKAESERGAAGSGRRNR